MPGFQLDLVMFFFLTKLSQGLPSIGWTCVPLVALPLVDSCNRRNISTPCTLFPVPSTPFHVPADSRSTIKDPFHANRSSAWGLLRSAQVLLPGGYFIWSTFMDTGTENLVPPWRPSRMMRYNFVLNVGRDRVPYEASCFVIEHER